MFFPLFLDLSHKEILIVGAGRIARRRIRTLSGFAGRMTVVSPDISADFAAFVNEGAAAAQGEEEIKTQITMAERCFEASDLNGKDIVLAATDDAELNRQISELCHAQGILVNVCTDAGLCDFQFPSVVETGAVVIGLNASGRDHHLVKETRRQVEALFDEGDFKSKYEII